MFQISTTSYGPFVQHTVFHAEHQDRFSVVLDRGAVLTELVLHNHPVLEGFSGPAEVDINPWSKNRLLFPFPNRLAGGTYQWEGTSYQFPLNDDQRQNALHGFDPERNFQLLSSEEDLLAGRFMAEYRYDGGEEYYPFPFVLTVIYQFTSAHQFRLEMRVRNTGSQTMPLGLGWHPYFQLGDHIGQTKLATPSLHMMGVNQHMIPTGKKYEYDQFQSAKVIGSEVLDNCFVVPHTAEQAEVTLSEGDLRLKYWQESGPGQFRYLQIFTPPHRQSIALEPMSCNVDAFNNGEDLIKLGEEEEVRMSCGVGLA